MADGGYIGKMLFVDLSVASVREEPLDRSLTRQFVGGYGLGARIFYSCLVNTQSNPILSLVRPLFALSRFGSVSNRHPGACCVK